METPSTPLTPGPSPPPTPKPKRVPWIHPANLARKTAFGIGDSPLERLPAEVLQAVFISSANPNLPLVSRTLLRALPPTLRLTEQLAFAIVGARSHWAKGTLVTRRFCSPELFCAALEHNRTPCVMNQAGECSQGATVHPNNSCPYHVRFDAKLHVRFFANIVGRVGSAGQQRTPWQIVFLCLLRETFVLDTRALMQNRKWPAKNETVLSAELRAAAQASLHAAVVGRNEEIARFLTYYTQQPALDSGAILVKPAMATVRHAVLEQDCAHLELVTAVFNGVWYWNRNPWEDPDIEVWIARRKALDAARATREAEERMVRTRTMRWRPVGQSAPEPVVVVGRETVDMLGRWVGFLWAKRYASERTAEEIECLDYEEFEMKEMLRVAAERAEVWVGGGLG